MTRGVELLAWMVAQGHLEVKVGIRVHRSEGRPVPLDYRNDGYVHEKWAIFSDGEDTLVASGSLNESRTALEINAENLDIRPDWNDWGAEYVRRKERSFEAMWAGEHPAIRTFELPEAIRDRLLRISQRLVRLVEIDGTPPPDAVRRAHGPERDGTHRPRSRAVWVSAPRPAAARRPVRGHGNHAHHAVAPSALRGPAPDRRLSRQSSAL
ncbi:MAG: hypothetical protein U5L11_10755 [Arhodomonas sp.]|nr:hypothetical protein [Arhodomonas sp.]